MFHSKKEKEKEKKEKKKNREEDRLIAHCILDTYWDSPQHLSQRNFIKQIACDITKPINVICPDLNNLTVKKKKETKRRKQGRK